MSSNEDSQNVLSTLIFSSDKPSNTTIHVADNSTNDPGTLSVLYRVETSTSTAVTRVSTGAGDTVAQWNWKRSGSFVSFRDATPKSMRSWLKKGKDHNTVTFSDSTGREFKWKQRMVYAGDDDDMSRPIAKFIPSQGTPPSKPPPKQKRDSYMQAKLDIFDHRGEEILEFILISLLILQRRRMEKRTTLDWVVFSVDAALYALTIACSTC